jgi:nucleoside-diphosphate-sugar epimerase
VNILLTGGTGFLGSALAKALQAEGHHVSLLLRPSSVLTRLNGREHLFALRRCEDKNDIAQAIVEATPDFVVHTACCYGRGNETDLEILEANFLYGAQILQSITDLGTRINFINIGTPLPPSVSVYALSKHNFSSWAQAIAQRAESKVRFLNVLLQHMYGPSDDPSKFTSTVINACRNHSPELKLTHGTQRRDWIYIEDAISAFLVIIRHFEKLEDTSYVEVGSGTTTTVREFAETVKRLTKSRTELLFGEIPCRINETLHCQANLATMTQIGWRPIFDLVSGLRKTLLLETSR